MVKQKTKVIFGGWYQRTTLHLSEVQRFLLYSASNSNLSKEKLDFYKKNLEIKFIKRVAGSLEYLHLETKNQIEIKYYEDGLYVLSKEGEEIDKIKNEIKSYFDKKFKPAIDYLFSKGAPTPKVLSNIKDNHSFIIGQIKSNLKEQKVDSSFGEVYFETISKDVKVSKTKENILITVGPNRKKELEILSEMQIFFSEFKIQLHKYLDIHRKIWDEISEIKEKESVRGRDVSKYRSILDSYQKTIRLIGNRINQMRSYAQTRKSISEKANVHQQLIDLFQYRFEDLFNTLDYIKEIWKMTSDYVDSAIQVMVEMENKLSSKGLKSIQLIISIGVVAGLLRYLSPDSIPEVAFSGFLFVLALGIISYAIDYSIKWSSKNKKYKLKFIERTEDL